MIRKLENLLNDAHVELSTEEYEWAKELMLDDYEYKIYQTGYIDGLKAALAIEAENDSSHSYTIEMDDIFDSENEEIHGAED